MLKSKIITSYKNERNVEKICRQFNLERNYVVEILNQEGFDEKIKKPWTNEDISILTSLAEELTPDEISIKMDRRIKSITTKMQQLGLHSISSWSQDDEDFLCDYWGFMQIEAIAQKLNRTVLAVKKKAKQLNLLSARDDAGFLKLSDVSEITGISVYVLKKFGERKLKIKTNYITKKMSYQYIDLQDLLDFLYYHQEEFNAAKFNMIYIYNAPDWLIKKRKTDIEKEPVKYERWDNADKNTVKRMFSMGKSIKDIAEKFKRTELAVKNICYEK